MLIQVQCARSDFAYARDAKGNLLKDREPADCSQAFVDKYESLMEAARHGAVLVSPCISHGEKEIARRAFASGAQIITLQNKGFSPFYKPGGELFDHCADGNLLMLAPVAWPYLPGEKKITRVDACVLNRITQLLCGEGAAVINYCGMSPQRIDRLAFEAMEII